MAEVEKAVSVRITGRVQGVGFRAWTWRQAEMRGLRGWVRNEADGSVAAVVAGPAAEVDAMIVCLRQGPDGALVREVLTEAAELPDEPAGFNITR